MVRRPPARDTDQEYALGLGMGSVARVEEGPCPGIRLGEFMDRGAVGRLFEVEGDPWSCVKVFDRPSPQLDGKVRELVRKYERGELAPRTAAWPRALLVSPSGRVVGYLMDRIWGRTLSEVACGSGLGLAERARIASGYARRLSECHGRTGSPVERTLVVGDGALANALLDERTGEPRLVDADAFQVASSEGGRRVLYPVCEQHSPSPESVDGVGRRALSARHDNYLCAKGCFELIMGCDPLVGEMDEEDAPEDASERAVRAREFPYLESVRAGTQPDPRLVVGGALALLFERSFTGPFSEVPSCGEYAAVLASIAEAPVSRCPSCGEEYLSEASERCPWCEAAEALPRTRVAPAPTPAPASCAASLPSSGSCSSEEPPSPLRWWQVALALLVITLLSVLLGEVHELGTPVSFVVGVVALGAHALVRSEGR